MRKVGDENYNSVYGKVTFGDELQSTPTSGLFLLSTGVLERTLIQVIEVLYFTNGRGTTKVKAV